MLVVLVVLVLSNLVLSYYLYKTLLANFNAVILEINSISVDINRFTQYAESYQSLQGDYVRNLHEYITMMCKEGDEYRSAINKAIKDLPKEIVIKNVLSV